MFIADFHIHSKYSRATSEECIPEMLELWARRKGLALIGTGDFTHPVWREELKARLVPAEEGLYTLKEDLRREDQVAGNSFRPRFIVSGEISSIYKKKGKVRKVHNLILLPGLEAAETLSHRLEAIGNLHSDGRPILGLDSRDLLEITLEVCPEAIFIPAHIWTPHFSLFGAYSGFDDIRECFEDLTDNIHALETGLSSDPPMNWRLSALDKFTLVSNSDAHSPANLAREANLFNSEMSYPGISRALQNRNTKEFAGTIEFFPEEGKYHYDGHRNCKVCLKPEDTRQASGVCPVCGGKITVGVLHRVEALADRDEGFVPPSAKSFQSLIPLHEVIAASIGLTTVSQKVKEKYADMIRELGPELFILREAPLSDVETQAGPLVSEGIRRLRTGKVEVLPGYDGEYGKIKILDKEDIGRISGQLGLFHEKSTQTGKAKANKKPKSQATEDSSKKYQPKILVREKDSDKTPDELDGLNTEQREAVVATDPIIAVIAGPGTGKTRTLVSRIAYLIEKGGVSPAQITAVTFTNKAAAEMRSRLTSRFGNEGAVKQLTIGTFHSICLQILSGPNGKSNLTVIDEDDCLSIVEDILTGLHLKNTPRKVLQGISWIKSGAPVSKEKTDIPPGVYDRYCAQLEKYGVLDYDDILLKALGSLESRNTGGLENNSMTHLLVDEFQDINPVQYRLIKEWGRNSAGIFVIGDPNQSIYGFRGADASCFKRLAEDFPNLKQIRLTQNYRSTPEIINCAQAVISKPNGGGIAGTLKARRNGGVRVRLLEANDDFSEAIFVAREINRLVGGMDMLEAHKSPASRDNTVTSGTARGFSDIAVLYRTNHQAKILEQCLLKEGIQYRVVGRDDFLSQREVRHAVAFFRFLLNPADLVSLRLGLKDNVQSDLVSEILDEYTAAEKSLASLSEVIPRHLTHAGSSKFIVLLQKYEPRVRQEKPQNLIQSWIDDNGLQGQNSLEMLLNMAVLEESMPVFLQNLLLGRESDLVRSSRKSYSPDAVSLMTLHGAKGLEFPVVFLCGVREGMIPLHNHDGDNDLDEERRLFYVGLTRAQDELVLLVSGAPSPFLSDIPQESLSKEKTFIPGKAPQFEQLSFFNT